MKPKRTSLNSVLLILFAASLWAMSGVFIDGVVRYSDLAPIQIAFLRELSTFLILLGYLWLKDRKLPRIEKKDWVWLVLMGGFGIGFFHLVWNLSVITNGVSVATMLQYNEVILVSLIAAFLFRESMNARKVLAIFGSLAGTALVSGLIGASTPAITSTGLLIGIVTAVSHAAFSLFGKKLSGSYAATTILLYAFGFGALVLLPFQFFFPLPTMVQSPAIASLAGSILGSTLISFAAYTAALKHIPVSTASILATSEVVFALLFGWLLLQEQLSFWQMAGGLLIVGGIVLVSLRPAAAA
ncbi:MAG: DMT family transporter [Anaerolineae bacterium]|jgi:drug/metabolite transporter (DMT)-like permease|nr:DMT family transporter [Anaerolineae bacterium]